MKLSTILTPKRINLNLKSTTKAGVLEELVRLLRLTPPAQKALLQTLQAREDLGSTGIGKGVAIPHCRSLVASEVLVAVGRSQKGINFKSMDRKRARLFFLVVAPPLGDPGDYLVVLGNIVQVARLMSADRRLKGIRTAAQFIKVVKELEQ